MFAIFWSSQDRIGVIWDHLSSIKKLSESELDPKLWKFESLGKSCSFLNPIMGVHTMESKNSGGNHGAMVSMDTLDSMESMVRTVLFVLRVL